MRVRRADLPKNDRGAAAALGPSLFRGDASSRRRRGDRTRTFGRYGLTFREQWYVVGEGQGFVLVAYKGDTQQGPYEGAFLYTREKDDYENNAGLRSAADAAARKVGLDPAGFCAIDNACPAVGVTAAGASAEDVGKEKLEWKDVFDLAEWFRPGTIAKSDNFDPNKM